MTTMPATRTRRTSGGALRMTPGRWVALAIGVPFALVLIGWSAFSLVAGIGRASFPVTTSIPLQHGRLVASTGGGDITVHQDQARSDKAQLIGTVQYSLIRPRLTINGDGLHLDCRLPTGNCGLSATVDVPLNIAAVNLASEGGNMQVNGIDSDLTLNSSGGDVNGTGLSSPQVTTESGGGNVTLAFTRAPVNLDISSDGGDITIVLPRGSTRYAITYNTDGGDYSAPVPVGSSSGHTINVQSGGGNVSIADG